MFRALCACVVSSRSPVNLSPWRASPVFSQVLQRAALAALIALLDTLYAARADTPAVLYRLLKGSPELQQGAADAHVLPKLTQLLKDRSCSQHTRVGGWVGGRVGRWMGRWVGGAQLTMRSSAVHYGVEVAGQLVAAAVADWREMPAVECW
jgi:hypothetical protein